MSTLWSDSFTASDGSSWDSAKWVDGSPAQPSSLRTVRDGWGRAVIPAGPAPLPVRMALTPPLDVEMTGRFRVSSTTVRPRFYLRANGEVDTSRGYYVEPVAGGSAIGAYRNGAQANQYGGFDATTTRYAMGDPVDVGFTFTAGAGYRFRFQVLNFIVGVEDEAGNVQYGGGVGVAAKFWPDGGAEPTDFQIEHIDPVGAGCYAEQTASSWAAGIRVTGAAGQHLELDDMTLVNLAGPVAAEDRVQVWTGTSWKVALPQVWTGSGWASAPVLVW